jgi:hypothetical protein
MFARSALKPRRQNAPRPAWKIASAYLQWLRGRDCAVASSQCDGRIEAAHTPDPMSKGMGTKAADFCAVPLCSFHHAHQHKIGWLTFARLHGIKDIEEWRRGYWLGWPGHREWIKTLEARR